MLLWDLGLSSFGGWIGSSAESWDSTLVLLAALVILCFEVRCGVAVMAGKNWGRWGYLIGQGVISGYMLLAHFSDFLPDIFTLAERQAGTFYTSLPHSVCLTYSCFSCFLSRTVAAVFFSVTPRSAVPSCRSVRDYKTSCLTVL